jgi:preprotein translocase subunit SecE
VNRETKRMMQRQGQMEADGSPSVRRSAPARTAPGRGAPAPARRPARRRTSVGEFLREVREELRQVAWPNRSEMINYSTVVLTTLVLMISLIFVLNLLFGKAIVLLFQR